MYLVLLSGRSRSTWTFGFVSYDVHVLVVAVDCYLDYAFQCVCYETHFVGFDSIHAVHFAS